MQVASDAGELPEEEVQIAASADASVRLSVGPEFMAPRLQWVLGFRVLGF